MLLRCYPKITDWIFHFFNQASWADYRFLPLYSYGFFVATGFFAAATIAVAEMRRREKLGLLPGVEQEITTGGPPSLTEIFIYFLFGFIIAFKVTGMVAFHEQLRSHQLAFGTYLMADHDGGIVSRLISIFKYGSWSGGLLLGVLLAAYYYYRANQQKTAQPEKNAVMIYPSDSIGDLLIIALILGVLGSNLFNFLESPGDYKNFWQDPFSSIFSGLSVYGGLICAGTGFLAYAVWRKFRLAHFFDSIAPGFILANGLGRIGCQVSGDGDWGIANLNPKPGWLPQFLWSTHYQHNIIDADPGNFIPGCSEEHCHFLTYPVYPTPIYEFLMCTAIFLILWSLRKRLTNKPGMLFAIFTILIGIQRYTIEQWRDISSRDLYHVFGFAFRQSELISMVLFVIGITGMLYLYNRYRNKLVN